MLCPSCGTPATTDQQFCRACGLNLEVIGKLVADHAAGSSENQTRLDRVEVEKAIYQRMFSWMTLGLILVAFGVVLLILGKSLDLPRPFETLTPLILLGGIAVATGGLISGIRKGVDLGGRRSGAQLRQPDPRVLPTRQFEGEVTSITEQTTNLMPVEAAKDKRATNEIAE